MFGKQGPAELGETSWERKQYTVRSTELLESTGSWVIGRCGVLLEVRRRTGEGALVLMSLCGSFLGRWANQRGDVIHDLQFTGAVNSRYICELLLYLTLRYLTHPKEEFDMEGI